MGTRRGPAPPTLRSIGAIACAALVACSSGPDVSSREARASVCVHLAGVFMAQTGAPNERVPVVDALRVDVELLRSAGEQALAREVDELIEELHDDALAISVYLEDTATSGERESIRVALEGVPGVAGITFVDRAEAAEQFRELFANQPEFIENTPASVLPESWQAIVPADAAQPTLGDELGRLAGVRYVSIAPHGLDSFASEAFRLRPRFCDAR